LPLGMKIDKKKRISYDLTFGQTVLCYDVV
jgi:hypothetical protein